MTRRDRPRWLAVSSWIMAALFLLAVAVQYNDPDPALWMVVYGTAAALSLAAARGRLLWRLAAAVAVLCLVWGASLVPRFLGVTTLHEILFDVGMKTLATELAREALGLWLVAAWLAVVASLGYRHRR